jgi:hypothetical protein
VVSLASRLRYLIILLGTLPLLSVQSQAKPDKNISTGCPTDVDLSRWVAQTDLILIGRLDVPADALRTAIRNSSKEYLEAPVSEARWLKGEPDPGELVVKIYSEPTPYYPPAQALLDLSGKPSLIFLQRVDYRGAASHYLNGPEALQAATPSAVAAVEAELARQARLLGRWKPSSRVPHYGEIRVLMKELSNASRARQAAIFRKLEKLGHRAVPALIAQLDDRRRLAHPEISLVNHSPDAFEGIRHYGPERVVDAIDAILNQITGTGGSIVNGGSERERRNAVSSWRVYIADLACRAP